MPGKCHCRRKLAMKWGMPVSPCIALGTKTTKHANSTVNAIIADFARGFTCVFLPNDPAHRRRADGARLRTETRSRRSVQPMVGGFCFIWTLSGNQAATFARHPLPAASSKSSNLLAASPGSESPHLKSSTTRPSWQANHAAIRL